MKKLAQRVEEELDKALLGIGRAGNLLEREVVGLEKENVRKVHALEVMLVLVKQSIRKSLGGEDV